MTERLHIGTHKGLFELARHNGVWDIADVQFLGDPVSAVLAVTDGIVYAALDLGHFGAKLWRRNRTGNWRELPVPSFPPSPRMPVTIPIPGRSARSGHSNRAGFRVGFGQAQCRAGFSAPMTAANPGR